MAQSRTAAGRAADVRAKTGDELDTLLLDLRKEQFNLRFQRATGQQEGTARVRHVRREIARVKTIMREKQTASGNGAQPAKAAAVSAPAPRKKAASKKAATEKK